MAPVGCPRSARGVSPGLGRPRSQALRSGYGATVGRLDDLDLTLRLSAAEEAKRLEAAQQRLLELRLLCGGLIGDSGKLGPPLCIVFEGWDASGKGGCIKRLVAPLDPRHVRVAQFQAPTYDEKRHHFLWRVLAGLAGGGGVGGGGRGRGRRRPRGGGGEVAAEEHGGGGHP